MSDLEKRLRDLIGERTPSGTRQSDDVTMQFRHLAALVQDAARIGAEAAFEDAARWVADREAWPVGAEPPEAHRLAVADDIRAHAMRVLASK